MHSRLKDLLEAIEGLDGLPAHLSDPCADFLLDSSKNSLQRLLRGAAGIRMNAGPFGHQLLEELRCAIARLGEGSESGEIDLMKSVEEARLRPRSGCSAAAFAPGSGHVIPLFAATAACVFALVGSSNHRRTIEGAGPDLNSYFPQEGAPMSKAESHHRGDELREQWSRLHQTDREPWPDAHAVGKLAKGRTQLASSIEAHGGAAAVAAALQEAWGAFHSGAFARAVLAGEKIGALGAAVANKAAAIDSLYSKRSAAQLLRALESAIARGEQAVAELPDHPNTHYTLALVLGRYSQRISILKALAAGLASRVREHLERTLALEPRHAEAHLALGLYHAEIVGKLGSLAASLTYGATSNAAMEHFRQALTLAPASPIVRMEYAHGLLLLDATRHLPQAQELYSQAAACEPADAMERLDVARARRGLAT
jgi:tetratricopeptide (TPR) repeat protein